MKTFATYCLMLSTLLFTLTFCSAGEPKVGEETPIEKDQLLKDEKVLIVYLSRTKNTKALAEIIHKKVGGDLVALVLENPYPENYKTVVEQVARENEIGYLPPLKSTVDNMEEYDVIFIGFPTWGMRLPPPVKSFLNQYDLRGKTIVPFNTNAGYGVGNSFETVKQSCRNSNILEGFSTEGGVERDGILFVMEGDKKKEVQAQVESWLKKIGREDLLR